MRHRERAPVVPATGGTVELAVRPLGTLVVAPGALGVGALRGLELIDALSGETAEQRVARGLISVLHGEDGSREFQGIPAGEYRWTAHLADGRTREGTVEVAAGARTLYEIPPE